MENFLKKKYVVFAILFLIVAGALAVRLYNHEEWLYFKMDQARDAALISRAVESGPGQLPLLGPRAGAVDLEGGFLRLGPAYYYFQYLAGAIFNSTDPHVFAYPDLFFSLAVLPLLYAFCRLYFRRYISMLIVLMYAFSFLIIQYSRFAWNPNPLPFFVILSFLALLKFLNSSGKKYRGLWIMLWSLGLAIGSQLHFVGFFALAGISGLLIAYHYNLWHPRELRNLRQNINLKKAAVFSSLALAVFVFCYVPVIVSDVMRGGENARNFVAALGSKAKEKPLYEKFARNVSEQLEHYTLITTAYIYPKKLKPADSFPIIFTLAVFIGGFYLIVRNLRKDPDGLRNDFRILILLWFGVFFILCVPLAFQIRPRFFIVTFALPFLLLGFIFERLEDLKVKRYPMIIAALTAIVLLSNAYGTKAWFKEQGDSQKDDTAVRRTLILKTKDGVTLAQLQRAADFMYENLMSGNTLYYYTKPEHVSPVKYLLRKKDPALDFASLSLNGNPHAQYFAVIPSQNDPYESLKNKYGTEVEILSSQNCGQISIHEINFPQRTSSKDFRYNKIYAPSDRVFWSTVFNGSAIEGEKEDSMEEIDINE